MQSLMAYNALSGARGAYAAPNARANLNRRVSLAVRRPARGAVTVRAGKTPDGPKVAIAGISGAVGTEFMRVRNLFLLPLWLTPPAPARPTLCSIFAPVLTRFLLSSPSTHFLVSPSINFHAPKRI